MLKEEFAWTHYWDNFYRLKNALDKWIKNYNTDFLQSSLKWKTPEGYEKYSMLFLTKFPLD